MFVYSGSFGFCFFGCVFVSCVGGVRVGRVDRRGFLYFGVAVFVFVAERFASRVRFDFVFVVTRVFLFFVFGFFRFSFVSFSGKFFGLVVNMGFV